MWSRALALSVLCLWPATSFAAVAFDAVGSVNGAGVTSLSFSMTTAGSDRALAGGTQVYQSGAAATVSSMTYNGVALTDSATATNGTRIANQRYLVAPASGSNTFQCNYSNTGSFDLGCLAISMTGVDQSTPTGTANTATGSSTTPSVVVSSATDELVVDTLFIDHTAALSVGAGQTERVNAITSNGFIKYTASTEPGASSVTMDWTNGGSTTWAIVATPFKAVAVGGGAVGTSLVRGMMFGGGK